MVDVDAIDLLGLSSPDPPRHGLALDVLGEGDSQPSVWKSLPGVSLRSGSGARVVTGGEQATKRLMEEDLDTEPLTRKLPKKDPKPQVD